MSAVEVERLTKRFEKFTALDEVDLAVPAGRLVAVLGPNGAGKTTLVEILEGFQERTSGSVRVLGADPARAGRAWRSRIGLVLQSTSLESEATVTELLSVFARSFPDPRPVGEVVDLVDLTSEARVRIGTLSGGQQRRVDLALAVIGKPEILFLDEPTTGLDPQARRRCWSAIENLTASGTTVFLTTHYLDEADQLADRIVVLSCGHIVADATPAQLRAGGRGCTIRFPVPAQIPLETLPPALAGYVDRDDRVMRASDADPARLLPELLGWARRYDVELSALQVGPPSLEDVYLTITGAADRDEVSTHA